MTQPMCSKCGRNPVLKAGEKCNSCLNQEADSRLIDDLTKPKRKSTGGSKGGKGSGEGGKGKSTGGSKDGKGGKGKR